MPIGLLGFSAKRLAGTWHESGALGKRPVALHLGTVPYMTRKGKWTILFAARPRALHQVLTDGPKSLGEEARAPTQRHMMTGGLASLVAVTSSVTGIPNVLSPLPASRIQYRVPATMPGHVPTMKCLGKVVVVASFRYLRYMRLLFVCV